MAPMVPAPDAVAAAMVNSLRLLVEATGRGWVKSTPSVATILSKAPIPTLNGVWTSAPETRPEEIEAGLDAVIAHGVPYCIQARPRSRAVTAGVAKRREMVPAPEIPLMAAIGPVSVREPRELAIRRLELTESLVHAEVAGAAFGAPPDLFTTIITERTLGLAGLRGYVGEVAGRPVTTAIAAALGGAVGVFNVATLPEHRRRGYGAAVTARAVSDARAAGASWSWLQATDVGYGVYQRLGFMTLERWSCWLGG